MGVTVLQVVAAGAIVPIVTFAILVAINAKKRRALTKGYPLPPGPPTRWFWDDVMPVVNISATFNEWANEYGPVFTVRQGAEITITIARVNAATEIMEKEGSALADRPPMIAANEFLSGCKRITLINNGERFRRLRKAIHAHFQPKAVVMYGDIQSEQAKTIVLDLLDDPKNHQKLAYRFSTSIILRVTYGKSSPTSIDDPEFVGVKQAIQHFIETMRPGAYLVDRFPWSRHVPGYGRRLKQYYESDLKFYCDQLNRVKFALSSDDAGPSFSRTLLEDVNEHQLSFDEMAFLAGTLFEAGSDTAYAMIAMIMAAACFPHEQSRVQAELDKAIGIDRALVPSWNDWNRLPRLHAFISEVLRWRPVTPLGFAHCATRDIFWRGYRIPAGTKVLGHQWSISRDPAVFPNPDKFDPQRWLDQHGQLRNDVECYPFGFGRRRCPGMHLANRSIFIGLAFLLWAFRIVERPEAPIDTTPDNDNVQSHMAPFEVNFEPRIERAQLREMI